MAGKVAQNLNAGEFVHPYWKNRVFIVSGTKLQGSGVLLDQKQIFTAAHLGFKLNEEYQVRNLEYGQLSTTCIYINKKYDFAILKNEQLPEMHVVHGLLDIGREYCILGFPRLANNDFPSINQGSIENTHSDQVHLIGTPGAQRGYSGGPVVSKGSVFYGLLLGGIDELTASSTFQHAFDGYAEQKTVRILPYSIIVAVCNSVPTDSES